MYPLYDVGGEGWNAYIIHKVSLNISYLAWRAYRRTDDSYSSSICAGNDDKLTFSSVLMFVSSWSHKFRAQVAVGVTATETLCID